LFYVGWTQGPAQPGELTLPPCRSASASSAGVDQGSRLSEAIAEFERDPTSTEQRSEQARSDGEAFGSPNRRLLSFGRCKEIAWPLGHPRPATVKRQKAKKDK